jgi:hypothetical protein
MERHDNLVMGQDVAEYGVLLKSPMDLAIWERTRNQYTYM